MLTCNPLGIIRQIVFDCLDNAQMLVSDNKRVTGCPNGHSKHAVTFGEPQKHLIARNAHNLQMKRPICGPHFFKLVFVRKLQDLICHVTQYCEIGLRSMPACASRRQAFEKLTHLVRFAQARGIQLSYENSKTVDRIHKPQPLQLDESFAHAALPNPELFGQALLHHALARLAFSRQDAALNLLPHITANRG